MKSWKEFWFSTSTYSHLVVKRYVDFLSQLLFSSLPFVACISLDKENQNPHIRALTLGPNLIPEGNAENQGSISSPWKRCTSSNSNPYRSSCSSSYNNCNSGSGWSITQTVSLVKSGNQAFINRCSQTWAFLEYTIAASTGSQYRFSFYAKATGTNSGFHLYVGVDSVTMFSFSTNTMSTSYTQYSGVFVATSTTQTIFFSGNGDPSSNNCKSFSSSVFSSL